MIPQFLELLVGEDDEAAGTKNELRPLVEAEAIKVVEALLLGQTVMAARSDQLAPIVALLPETLRRQRLTLVHFSAPPLPVFPNFSFS